MIVVVVNTYGPTRAVRGFMAEAIVRFLYTPACRNRVLLTSKHRAENQRRVADRALSGGVVR